MAKKDLYSSWEILFDSYWSLRVPCEVEKFNRKRCVERSFLISPSASENVSRLCFLKDRRIWRRKNEKVSINFGCFGLS